jgi:hypothetical protein
MAYTSDRTLPNDLGLELADKQHRRDRVASAGRLRRVLSATWARPDPITKRALGDTERSSPIYCVRVVASLPGRLLEELRK